MTYISLVSTSQRPAMSRLLFIGDALLIVAAIPIAWYLHHNLRPWLPFLKDSPALPIFATAALLLLPIWLALTSLFKSHNIFNRLWRTTELAWPLLKLHGTMLVIITIALFASQFSINRTLVIGYLGIILLLQLALRMLLQMRLRYRLALGSLRRHILLVGDDTPALQIFAQDVVAEDPHALIIGRIGNAPSAAHADNGSEHSAQSAPHVDHIGPLANFGLLLHTKTVDQVFFFPPHDNPAIAEDALKECEALGVPALFYVHTPKPLQAAPKLALLHRRPFFLFDLTPGRQNALALKYVLDVAGAAVGLILLSPLMLLVALLILITMGRPVLYSQARTGLFGREFKMYKFRSMVANAEKQRNTLLDDNEMSGPVFKIKTDPRVTRLGRMLRKSSIDELPQLFNVLIGDMSLVGPRPLIIQEQQNIVGWKRRRLSMRPGISGLWQVSGRSNIDFEEWMQLDLAYIDNWSLTTDAKILIKTIKVVLTGEGAS